MTRRDRTVAPLPRMAERSFGEFLRRRCVDQLTPAEKQVYDAIQAIEDMGADVRLTQAQTKLDEVRELLADYLEDPNVHR